MSTKSDKLRKEFKEKFKIDAVFDSRSANQPTYSFDYVHWLEDKILEKWKEVSKEFPDDEVRVLCYHIHSGTYFICYRTLDCLTQEPKWFDGAMPTHWTYIETTIQP